jgi:hypothetical protein
MEGVNTRVKIKIFRVDFNMDSQSLIEFTCTYQKDLLFILSFACIKLNSS